MMSCYYASLYKLNEYVNRCIIWCEVNFKAIWQHFWVFLKTLVYHFKHQVDEIIFIKVTWTLTYQQPGSGTYMKLRSLGQPKIEF